MKKTPSYQFAFEKLEVWQFSRELVGSIYEISANYPESEGQQFQYLQILRKVRAEHQQKTKAILLKLHFQA